MKKIVSFMLACVLLFSLLTSTVSANELSATEMLSSYIEEIENDLEMSGGSVIIGLDRLISELKLKKATLTDDYEIANADRLISIAESQKEQYIQIKNGVALYGGYIPVYSEAVSSVIAYFGYNGYLLAAEFLMHAVDNNVLDSTYNYPLYIDRIRSNEVIGFVKYTIGATGTRYGTASFEADSTNPIMMDLYYAIHNFSYYATGNGNQIIVHDRYDFAIGDYDGIASAAVNTMWLAQQYGAITPFYINVAV